MLHEFLTANYQTLVARCRAKVAKRTVPRPSDAELLHGIPLFLEQLIKTLQIEETSTPLESRKVSGPSEPGKTPVSSEIGTTAAKHGNELLRQGFTVDQVVHDYGDLCQAITELAVEQDAPVTTDEFRTLNRCLDNAIADAVTEFGRQRDNLISTEGAQAMGERLGSLAHELRNLLDSAMLAVAAIKAWRRWHGRGHRRGARSQFDRPAQRHRSLACRRAPRSWNARAARTDRPCRVHRRGSGCRPYWKRRPEGAHLPSPLSNKD